MNQTVITRLLALYGCDSEMVGDGLAAVHAAETGRFDVVLMDVEMPVMDGVEAARELVQRMGEKAPGILAMTAHDATVREAECREAGMAAFLSKPVRPEALRDALLSCPSRSMHMADVRGITAE